MTSVKIRRCRVHRALTGRPASSMLLRAFCIRLPDSAPAGPHRACDATKIVSYPRWARRLRSKLAADRRGAHEARTEMDQRDDERPECPVARAMAAGAIAAIVGTLPANGGGRSQRRSGSSGGIRTDGPGLRACAGNRTGARNLPKRSTVIRRLTPIVITFP